MTIRKKPAKINMLQNDIKIDKSSISDKVIALAGNPNVGKSSIFNHLTGLNQHTGNWPGKTVSNAQGKYIYNNRNYIVIDIPGTYSLMASSAEEEVARDFICFGNPDVTVVVVDATCLERNLNLVLQTLEITHKVIVCVNLIDEAKRKKIHIDTQKLSIELGVPVVATNGQKGIGLDKLIETIEVVASSNINASSSIISYDDAIEMAVLQIQGTLETLFPSLLNTRWIALKLIEDDTSLVRSMSKYLNINVTAHPPLVKQINNARSYLVEMGIDTKEFRDKVVSRLVHIAEQIAKRVVTFTKKDYNTIDRKIDKYLTSKIFGIPIMLLLLGVIFWLTITGANIPSELLSTFFFFIEDRLTDFFTYIQAPSWVYGLLVKGIYRTLAWVVSVMLPPMAIFFPLFTFLEDLGYLPRIAFNLDNFFKKSRTCGKQALTMCMGFGCNAAGVIGCRIIDSPRERLIASITNNFVPCNGRFPILIAVISMFFTGMLKEPMQSIISSALLTVVIIVGVIVTLITSKFLSLTLLKGVPSSFTLELPPYRKPQIGKIIIRSLLDRTLFVLGRAVCTAIPAGAIIWLMANIYIYDINLLTYLAQFLDPFAKMIGLDGYILIAFILGLPANEIVIPIIIMSYMATGNLIELDSLDQLRTLLLNNNWTPVTAICMMLFTLMHWPCATTCLTIKKETNSIKWTLVSFLLPTLCGIFICFIVANVARLLGF
jgi:ferrous iron transport protein B